ncbi:MAG TPA: lamin tail domain-containing protein, partial [Verrucomicrobiota bacterium]|nr:lamin tail domain-containing protein [Verrucomicrobiota bacterium]
DRFGERDPWLEIFNAGATTVDLSGLHLSDTPANLARWTFPGGVTIPPRGHLLVWADGQPAQSIATELHTSFRLNPTNGVVLLSRQNGAQAEVIDYLTWNSQPPGVARGLVPDGSPGDRFLLHAPTPGAPNSAAAPPVPVFINEWMASNSGAVADPADGRFEDWFELYNAGGSTVDLSGFTLTDNLNDPGKFTIPNGVTLPAGGFLIVWADGQPEQTAPGQLHVNFSLAAGGEELGLFAPDGTPVDT